MEAPQILEIQEDLSKQKDALQILQNQTTYLVDTFDKLTERFNGMAKCIGENQKTLLGKIEENSGKLIIPKYTLRPTRSDQIGEISKAMATAKAKFSSVLSSGKGNRGAYATIDDLVLTTAETLGALELDASFFEGMNEHGELTLSLLVSHSSGQWFETTTLLYENEGTQGPYHQKVGAANTYMRRFMFRSMFNLGEEK